MVDMDRKCRNHLVQGHDHFRPMEHYFWPQPEKKMAKNRCNPRRARRSCLSLRRAIASTAMITTMILFLSTQSNNNNLGNHLFGWAFSPSSLPSPTWRTSRFSPTPIAKTKSTRNQSPSNEKSKSSLDAFPRFLSSSSKVAAMATPLATRTSPFAPLATILASLASLTEIIFGGVLSGTLHAIAGPDHLAALIPRCCGLPWHKAARVGALWGMGHGVSATLLGICGFLFKRGVRLTGMSKRLGVSVSGLEGNFNLLHHAGSFMELAIGISLVVIGLLGIKEAREFEVPKGGQCEVLEGGEGVPKSLSSAATPVTNQSTKSTASPAIMFNGLLHGLSWDGAPSLAPAVAISSFGGSLTFLLSYALGTMAAMTVSTALIGEGTKRAIEKAMKNGKGKGDDSGVGEVGYPTLPRDLSMGSSFLAMAVGIVWCWLALR